jgi:hypothetical protein
LGTYGAGGRFAHINNHKKQANAYKTSDCPASLPKTNATFNYNKQLPYHRNNNDDVPPSRHGL